MYKIINYKKILKQQAEANNAIIYDVNCRVFKLKLAYSFAKINVIGLGYKNFTVSNRLYVLVGDSNYVVFNIPKNLKLFCRKNQIYFISSNVTLLKNFLQVISKIKSPNFYKGKGIIPFNNFKFTKLKVGKKQKFM